jgi:tetratricopeptide (TPR) repeat protein
MKTLTPSVVASQLAFVCALALHGAGAQAQSADACGSLANAYGPLDYRTAKQAIKVVEDFHFTPEVEALIGGKSGRIGGDLDYTLRASPNHHRALIATVRLAKRLKTNQVPDMRYSVDCWLERAVRFQPDDTVARMIYAQYLGSTGREDEAVRQLDQAIQIGSDNPLTQYNAGLIFAEMKRWDRALVQAHRAAELGVTRLELQKALQAAGRWREPAAESAEKPASSASQP